MKLSLSIEAKRMLALIAGQALIITVASAVYFRGHGFLPFAYGVLLTCVLNCVRVLLIERTVKLAVERPNAGGFWGGWQYLIRFVLTGAVLVFAALSDHINLWGAIIGVFTFQIAAHMLRFFIARDNAKLEGGPKA